VAVLDVATDTAHLKRGPRVRLTEADLPRTALGVAGTLHRAVPALASATVVLSTRFSVAVRSTLGAALALLVTKRGRLRALPTFPQAAIVAALPPVTIGLAATGVVARSLILGAADTFAFDELADARSCVRAGGVLSAPATRTATPVVAAFLAIAVGDAISLTDSSVANAIAPVHRTRPSICGRAPSQMSFCGITELTRVRRVDSALGMTSATEEAVTRQQVVLARPIVEAVCSALQFVVAVHRCIAPVRSAPATTISSGSIP